MVACFFEAPYFQRTTFLYSNNYKILLDVCNTLTVYRMILNKSHIEQIKM